VSHYYSQHATALRADLGRAISREQMRVLHTKSPARHFLVAGRQFLILGLATWGPDSYRHLVSLAAAGGGAGIHRL
jgi:hypothetical protein